MTVPFGEAWTSFNLIANVPRCRNIDFSKRNMNPHEISRTYLFFIGRNTNRLDLDYIICACVDFLSVQVQRTTNITSLTSLVIKKRLRKCARINDKPSRAALNFLGQIDCYRALAAGKQSGENGSPSVLIHLRGIGSLESGIAMIREGSRSAKFHTEIGRLWFCIMLADIIKVLRRLREEPSAIIRVAFKYSHPGSHSRVSVCRTQKKKKSIRDLPGCIAAISLSNERNSFRTSTSFSSQEIFCYRNRKSYRLHSSCLSRGFFSPICSRKAWHTLETWRRQTWITVSR